jgi:thiol-disulfide isomerase/thioredoxin
MAAKKSTKSTEITGQGPTTVSQFMAVVGTGERPVFLKIYAEWCGHCKDLIPVWKSLCDDQEMKTADINFVAVEEKVLNSMKISNKLAQKYRTMFGSVTGFPTIIYLDTDGNKVEDYKGDRNTEAMKKDIQEKLKANKLKGKGNKTGGHSRRRRKRSSSSSSSSTSRRRYRRKSSTRKNSGPK